MKLTQKQWELWFLLSTIIFLSFFFVGILENSKIDFPNWHYGMLGACVNMLLWIYVGCNPKYHKNEKT
jgi:hypothetical protein